MSTKEQVIKGILENSNGSWIDMITEGYEAGFAAATPATPSMQKAIEFLEFALRGDWRLNPHCKETRWRHVDHIGSYNYVSDGVTTEELYKLFESENPSPIPVKDDNDQK